METALQSFDQNAFHKAADIALLLFLKLGQALAADIIEEWNITGIAEGLEKADRGIEYLLHVTLEPIDTFSRVLHFGENEPLTDRVRFEIGQHVPPGATHHNVFQDAFANLSGYKLNHSLILRIGSIHSFEPFLQALKILFEIGDAGNCGVFGRLEQFKLGKDIVYRVV